jgi:CheY-like chemotaxis protein
MQPSLMKVLVVEDDPFVRDMAVTMLEDAGYEVIEVARGGQALTLLQAGIAVDALLTDIRIPEPNGWEVAKAYRERFPDLPVLYVTGYAEQCSLFRRDHHLEALQDCPGGWRPGNMGGLREADTGYALAGGGNPQDSAAKPRQWLANR